MAHASRPSAVGRGTLAFLYGLCEVEERRYRAIEHRFISRPDWEGRFHIVIYDIPETRRSERDALRAAAFADGWASPRPGVLLGMRPPGGWAECAGCSAGRLDVDLAARAWPLDKAARQIRRLAAHLEDVKDRWRDLEGYSGCVLGHFREAI